MSTPLPTPAPQSSQPALPRLLLVDDHAVHLHALFEMFRDHYEVFVATHGQQALELAASQLPDLVLADIVMPEISGLELCRRLKADAQTRDIPVIFLTSRDSPEEEQVGLEAGAVDFITKPFNPALVLARVRTHVQLKVQADRLRELASVDGLTGIANRRRFDERLEHCWRSCRRAGIPMSLLMIDIDHFKRYNDHEGHPAGDDVLRKVATVLQGSLRRSLDLVARYGGEEFACLLPGCGTTEAMQIADYLSHAVRKLQLPHPDSPTAALVTVSIGVASCTPGPDYPPHRLLMEADQHLYRAKAAGRNRNEC